MGMGVGEIRDPNWKDSMSQSHNSRQVIGLVYLEVSSIKRCKRYRFHRILRRIKEIKHVKCSTWSLAHHLYIHFSSIYQAIQHFVVNRLSSDCFLNFTPFSVLSPSKGSLKSVARSCTDMASVFPAFSLSVPPVISNISDKFILLKFLPAKDLPIIFFLTTEAIFSFLNFPTDGGRWLQN